MSRAIIGRLTLRFASSTPMMAACLCWVLQHTSVSPCSGGDTPSAPFTMAVLCVCTQVLFKLEQLDDAMVAR